MIVRRPEDGYRYRPSVFLSVERYAGPLYHEAHGLAHPLALMTSNWLGVERAISHCLDDFDDLRREGGDPGSAQYARTLDSHRELVCRVTEFIETLYRVGECLQPPPRRKKRVFNLEKERRHVALICNKLKHHQNFLVPVKGQAPDGAIAWGFAVYEVIASGQQRPNNEVHTAGNAFSLGIDIKRAVIAAYFAGERSAESIEKLGFSEDKPVPLMQASDSQRQSLLQRLGNLPCERFPFERGEVPDIAATGLEICLRKSGGRATRLREPVKMGIAIVPYTGALSVQVPL